MPGASFFAKLGVLIVPGFLRPADCAQVIDEMRAAPQRNAPLSVRGRADDVVDTRQRRSARADVSSTTAASVVNRFLAIKPEIERFFRSSFADTVEVPKFLIYGPGDFFIPHRDVKDIDEGLLPRIITARRINLIVNLNRAAEPPGADEYSGAALTLYGLIDEPQWRTYGFSVTTDPGTLVAFRSEVLHEVAPIVDGERYCIVSRMLDPAFRQPSSAGAAGEDPPE
jgi:SM-20-related protein